MGTICCLWQGMARTPSTRPTARPVFCRARTPRPGRFITSPNFRNSGRNSWWASNTTWHSSTTTRSNTPHICNRLTNSTNPVLTAASGVTNTILVFNSMDLRLSQMPALIGLSRHRRCKSSRNDTNGTITMVAPSGEQHAGNMNDKLLPPPTPAICTMGLSPRMIAWITACCWPRNRAAWTSYTLILQFEATSLSIFSIPRERSSLPKARSERIRLARKDRSGPQGSLPSFLHSTSV